MLDESMQGGVDCTVVSDKGNVCTYSLATLGNGCAEDPKSRYRFKVANELMRLIWQIVFRCCVLQSVALVPSQVF